MKKKEKNDRKWPGLMGIIGAISMKLPDIHILPTIYDKMTEEEEEEYIDAIIEEVRAEHRARKQHEE